MASAKKIRDEIMSMTIVVNSNPAQQEIHKLTQKNKELTDESKKLNKEREKIAQTLGEESQEYKDLTKKIEDNNTAVTVNKNKVKDLTDSLDINQMTVKQLRQELSLLNRALNERVAPGTEQYDALQKRIAEVRDRIKEVREGADDSSNGIEDLGNSFGEYAGIAATVVGTLAGITVTVQEIIDRNNEMADAMSAVEKTTGMTARGVNELSNAFTDFDTRTKKIDLLKIAEVGGRLGVAKSEILDFTREVDKAYVALGDSWKGGVDDLADSLGKIASIYKETKDQPIAQSINQIGSALNELAANGASSEQNIADFVNRLGSMPPAMKPALNTLLGFGSAFEESGINSEIASSGFSKFIRVASSNAMGFANIMKEPVAKVKEMINTDPASFFLKFSEGLRGLDGTQVEAILENLKLGDNEVQRVIGAATENTDAFRKSVETANQAVKEGTSLSDEFNKVNNNAAAIYEKIQKKFRDSLTSQAVASTLNTLVTAFGRFVGVVEDADGIVTGFRSKLIFLVKIIAILTFTTLSYNYVIGAYNALLVTTADRVLGLTIVEKARNLITAISRTLNTLYTMSLALMGAAYARVTGQTAQATFAMQAFNAAARANPLGILLTLVTLVSTAFLAYKSNAEESAKSQKSLNDVLQEGVKSAAEEITQLEISYRRAIKAKEGTEERKKAIQELQKQFPGYFGDLDAEKSKNEDLRKSYLALKDAIVASARAKAIESELQKRESERLKRDEEWRQRAIAEQRTLNELKSRGSGQTEIGAGSGEGVTFVDNSKLIEASNKRLKDLYRERFNFKMQDLLDDEYLHKELEKQHKKSAKLDESKNNETKSNYLVPKTAEELKAEKDAERARKKEERERLRREKAEQAEEKRREQEKNKILKAGEDAIQLEADLEVAKENAVIEAMKEGFEKEMAEIDLQQKRRNNELNKKKIGQTDINILQKKIDGAKDEDKVFFQALMSSWIDNNKTLEDVKEKENAIYNTKRKTLRIKSDNEALKDIEFSHQKEITELQRQKNEELAKYQTLAQLKAGLQDRLSKTEISKIKTWQDGKEALNKVYQQKEIDLQLDHLKAMIKLYEGLDLSILTKEQRDQILKFLDDAKTKYAEFEAQKTGTKTKTQEDLDKKSALGNQGSTDILGMSYDDWETFFTNLDTGANKLGTISAAIGALQNAFSTYYQFVQAKEQAQMQQVDTNAKRKEARLKKMLDKGLINQEQYDAEVQRLNQETEMEKWKLEYAAAKRQRNFMIGQTIANTAMAIMNIWAQPTVNPWVAAAMSVVVGALGAIQVATIAKQPLPEAPGFEDGFGLNYDMHRAQDGKKFSVVRKPLKSGPVYRPTHFIAGENNKVEMVIDNQTYKGFSPSFRKALHNEIAYSRGSQGFEGGYYPYLSKKQEQSSSREEMYAEVITNNTAAMNAVANKDFKAYVVKSMDSAKVIIEMTDEYNTYKNSAERK